MSSWSRVTGIFGGSFDPPHLGHEIAIQGLFKNPGLQRVWVLPSGNPPWKPSPTSAQARLEMAQEAFSLIEGVDVVPWEIELATKLPHQATTTWRTLEFIQPRSCGAELAWVIGTDQLLSIDRWDQFPQILGRCHWIILRRVDAHLSEEKVRQKLSELESKGFIHRSKNQPQNTWVTDAALSDGRPKQILLAETDAPQISSTEIREEAARSGNLKNFTDRGLLNPRVITYLKEKTLYGTRSHDL